MVWRKKHPHSSLISWIFFFFWCHSDSVSSNPKPGEEWTDVQLPFPREDCSPFQWQTTWDRQSSLPHVYCPHPCTVWQVFKFFLVYLPTSFREFQLYTRVPGPNFSPCLIWRLCLDSSPMVTLKTQSSRSPGDLAPWHSSHNPISLPPWIQDVLFWLLRSFLTCLSVHLHI